MATLGKSPKGIVVSAALVFIFIMAHLAFAETKVLVEECTYQASEYDSKFQCRTLAFEQAKRFLLEKLGAYLENETEVKNSQLKKGQIVALTAGIVRAEILEERWDGKTYFLKAKMAVDPNDVSKSIDRLRQDRQKTRELEETRRNADDALREVEKLRKELETGKAGRTEQDQYNGAVTRLSATDWIEKGYALGNAGQNQKAMEAFTRASELDPRNALAYINRAAAYTNSGNYQQAIAEVNKAIKLNPINAPAILVRGSVYEKSGNTERATEDYKKACELGLKAACDQSIGHTEAKIANAKTEVGNQSAQNSNSSQAIKAMDKAPEQDLKDAKSYFARGLANYEAGKYQEAIKDYDKAIALDSKLVEAYINRAGAYWMLGISSRRLRIIKSQPD